MNEARPLPTQTATRLDADPALRFLICGQSGDDRSTLVDRLFDGLEAGRDSNTAYRRFSTAQRAFSVLDAPNIEQCALGMTGGGAKVELAVLLVDARTGLLSQTRREAMIAGMLGISNVVLAVNEIDLVGYDKTMFDKLAVEFGGFVAQLGFKEIKAIPLSTRTGENVSVLSVRTPWYEGPPLRDYLETAGVSNGEATKPFRMPVRSVNSSGGVCALSGTIASGSIRPGDNIVVLPLGRSSAIKAIVGAGNKLETARAGEAVTVTLIDQFDIAPGDMLASLRERPPVADQFSTHIVWLAGERLMPGRSYLMKINDGTQFATITELKHRVDIDALSKLAAKTLGQNEVGVCNLSVASPIAFDRYADNRATGGFILIDRYSNATVAAGMIDFALRRASNIHLQNLIVSKAERTRLKQHRPAVLWFTGLPSAGKSTIANLVEAGLHARGVHTVMLDGDNVRHGLNKDLGFTESDRVENIRRIGEVARLMTEAGLIVLCSFISPFRAERRMVRELIGGSEFIEIFVDTPLKECIARDPKGLYARALAGEIKNFTGVDQNYEVPEIPELHLTAGRTDAGTLAHDVIEELLRRKIL